MGIFNYLRGWAALFSPFHPTLRGRGVAQLLFARQIKVAYTLVFLLSISDPDTRYERFGRLNGGKGEEKKIKLFVHPYTSFIQPLEERTD